MGSKQESLLYSALHGGQAVLQFYSTMDLSRDFSCLLYPLRVGESAPLLGELSVVLEVLADLVEAATETR